MTPEEERLHALKYKCEKIIAQAYWRGYSAALDEAAKVSGTIFDDDWDGAYFGNKIAAAIRALKTDMRK